MKRKVFIMVAALCLSGVSLTAMAAEKVIAMNNEFGGKTIETEVPGKKCTDYYNKANIIMKKICVSECGANPSKRVAEYHNQNGIRTKADVYLCPNFVYGSGPKTVNREVLSFDDRGARWISKDTYYNDKFVGKVMNR